MSIRTFFLTRSFYCLSLVGVLACSTSGDADDDEPSGDDDSADAGDSSKADDDVGADDDELADDDLADDDVAADDDAADDDVADDDASDEADAGDDDGPSPDAGPATVDAGPDDDAGAPVDEGDASTDAGSQDEEDPDPSGDDAGVPSTEPLETLWSENFDGDFGDWFVEGGNWAFGDSVYSNRPLPYAGTGMAGTGLNDDYEANSDSRLISPRLTIPAAAKRPRLRIHYWQLFGVGDSGSVEIRVGRGEWETLTTFEGPGRTWHQQLIDLSAYEGESVEFAFRLTSDATTSSAGLYIDEVSLETGSLTFVSPESFENGWGDWSVEGGDWAIGASVYSNRPAGHSGENYAGTGIPDDYGSNRDARLISPEFIVPADAEYPFVRYFVSHMFGPEDDGSVEVRELGGEWEATPDGVFTGQGTEWAQKRLDLTPWIGKQIQLGFRLRTNATTNSTGMFVDDITLEFD